MSSQSLNERLLDKYCIVKYSKDGDFLDLFPIQDDLHHIIWAQLFMMKDPDAILCITLNYYRGFENQVAEGVEDIRFITEFSLADNKFAVKGPLFPTLPEIYKRKYFRNYLSINYSDYPYCDKKTHRVVVGMIDMINESRKLKF